LPSCFRISLKFKTADRSVPFFYIVNLLLLFGAPKVMVAKNAIIAVVFYPLTYQKIFPQSANIVPELNRVKILDECIADAIVVKVNLTVGFNFIAKIATESGY
jgi:hypothetical protein